MSKQESKLWLAVLATFVTTVLLTLIVMEMPNQFRNRDHERVAAATCETHRLLGESC